MDKKDPDEMATGPEAGLTETCQGGRPPKTAPHLPYKASSRRK